MTGTVRFRITAIATLAVALALTAASIGLVVVQRQVLTSNLEDGIRTATNRVAALAADDALVDPLSPLAGDDLVAQVTDRSGAVVASTSNLATARAIGPSLGAGESAAWRTVDRLPGQRDPYRILSRRVETTAGPRIVHVGASVDDIDDATNTLAVSLAVAVPLVVVFVAALVWWLVGRTLRPVEAIRTNVARIEGTDLSRRVPEPPGTDEIARLARTMNAMLERIARATETQQRFVADASHELRGPLTRMRSELEVDRAHPETADPRATTDGLLADVVHLQQLVDDLLLLARSDADATEAARAVVDLDDIVLADVTRLRAETAMSVDAAQVSAAQIVGEPHQLARLVRNLTDNAARHARSTVTVTLGERGDRAVLVVSDDGPGIPPAERERVFERFTRLDDARTAGTGGAGLGLAIARDIVARHDGTIVVDGDRGTSFVVTLPLASS